MSCPVIAYTKKHGKNKVGGANPAHTCYLEEAGTAEAAEAAEADLVNSS